MKRRWRGGEAEGMGEVPVEVDFALQTTGSRMTAPNHIRAPGPICLDDMIAAFLLSFLDQEIDGFVLHMVSCMSIYPSIMHMRPLFEEGLKCV